MPNRNHSWQPRPLPRAMYNPYAIPGVRPLGADQRGLSRAPIRAPGTPDASPLYEIMRQPLTDHLSGLDGATLDLMGQALAAMAEEKEQEAALKYYRELFWYAVNIGAQGVAGAPIPAGALSPAGANKITMEADSNFEAYYDSRWSQDSVTGLINNPQSFAALVSYAGSRGVTSEDPNSVGGGNFLFNQNIFGSAQRPTKNVWPRVFPARSATEIALINREANPANFQLGFFGNKVFCGENPRKIIAQPPFSREPFTFAISFLGAVANVQTPGNVQILDHADFELLYITQDSPDGNAGDFEAIITEADGQKALSNIPLRRDLAYGTVERPTILTYPRYYSRGSRLLASLTNRNFAGATKDFQLAFHGNLIVSR